MKTRLKNILISRPLIVSTGVLIVGGIGVYLITASNAAVNAFGFEPETGILANGASQVTDASASAGKALKFGTGTTTRSKVSLGAAIQIGTINSNATYRNTFLQNFDSVSAEWEMKMEPLQPQQGQFNFATADSMVNFAAANGKKIRGHTTVWHISNPGWLTGRSWTGAQLDPVMKTHIQTVLTHFKGKVPVWDVVNEPFDDNGGWRPTVWYNAIGPNYIANALRYASEADPTAKLFINDYGVEWINPKSTAMYNLVRNLKAQGVPIHGVGFQAHLEAEPGGWSPTRDEVQANVQRFADLGLDVEFTELDVRTSPAPGTQAQKLQAQANIYANVANACQAVSRCTRITAWGVDDGHTWLGAAEMPLMFNTAFQPKPAYTTVRSIIGN
jgi:endo-1,4-beta-xylanase